MVSFDSFTAIDGIPIYLQILRFIKRAIISESVQNGDELPSRRVLSALLGINPNTVQKAYKMLEDEGLIESRSGAKSFIVLREETVLQIRSELMETDILLTITALKQSGISKEEALKLIEEYWEGGSL